MPPALVMLVLAEYDPERLHAVMSIAVGLSFFAITWSNRQSFHLGENAQDFGIDLRDEY